MKVKIFLVIVMGLFVADTTYADKFSATIEINTTQTAGTISPYILGNNLDWTEPLLKEDAELAAALRSTIIRYPGGTNSDTYHWYDGIGPLSSRKQNRKLDGSFADILMGTDEFLAYCKAWGAHALITVNIPTGTPAEAAAWVKYTRSTTPRVQYWEIGNEPYLEESIPEGKISPAEFARRASATIRAMKQVDPTIKVGLPLRNDMMGPTAATPYPGFNKTVLSSMTENFDFVTLHSSYFPVTFEKKETERELFLATMAGTRMMAEDMDLTQRTLQHYYPGRYFPIAITEYNALYSLDILTYGMAAVFLSKTDRYIESLAGALYTADALMLFARRPDVLMANFWSMNRNWWFGAIGFESDKRPQYYILQAFRVFLGAERLPTKILSPTMATPAAIFVNEQTDIPLLDALAVRNNGRIIIGLLNRSPDSAVTTGVKLSRTSVPTANTLSGQELFARKVAWQETPVHKTTQGWSIHLPPASFTIMTLLYEP